MKKKADKKKKKKFEKPVIVTKSVTDTVVSVYGTYGYPYTAFGGT